METSGKPVISQVWSGLGLILLCISIIVLIAALAASEWQYGLYAFGVYLASMMAFTWSKLVEIIIRIEENTRVVPKTPPDMKELPSAQIP